MTIGAVWLSIPQRLVLSLSPGSKLQSTVCKRFRSVAASQSHTHKACEWRCVASDLVCETV